MGSAAEDAKDRLNDVAEDRQEKLGDAKEKVGDALSSAGDSAKVGRSGLLLRVCTAATNAKDGVCAAQSSEQWW